MSPIYRKISALSFVLPPVWARRSTSSNRVAFRSTTSASAGPPWIITTWRSSAATTPGPLSGATARPAGWSCSPPSGATPLPQASFEPDDTLLLGRESAGVPAEVHAAADLRVRVPLQKGARSLNVALAAAMVLSEALRQTSGFPAPA